MLNQVAINRRCFVLRASVLPAESEDGPFLRRRRQATNAAVRGTPRLGSAASRCAGSAAGIRPPNSHKSTGNYDKCSDCIVAESGEERSAAGQQEIVKAGEPDRGKNQSQCWRASAAGFTSRNKSDKWKPRGP